MLQFRREGEFSLKGKKKKSATLKSLEKTMVGNQRKNIDLVWENVKNWRFRLKFIKK